MLKNKYIAFIFMLFTFAISHAQQEILYTQYVFSQLAVNPSYAGNDEGTSLTALSRKQWIGLKGSPASYSFLGQGLWKNKKTECRRVGRDKRSLIPINSNQVGVGVILFKDHVGVSNTYIASFAYAYKIKFSSDRRLSLGLQASMLNYSQSNSLLDNPDTSDPVFMENVSVFKCNFGTGIFYEDKRCYIGLSMPQILENKINPNTSSDKTLQQLFFTGGYVFYLNRFYKFKPTIMARYTDGLPVQVDINANLLYRDKVWLGISYRYTNSVNFMVDMWLLDNLRMGLAYDYPINEINKVSHGSVEVMVNYVFLKSKKRVSNPRYF
jgi:type IX secretion system PorP/SprF family membrane protein